MHGSPIIHHLFRQELVREAIDFRRGSINKLDFKRFVDILHFGGKITVAVATINDLLHTVYFFKVCFECFMAPRVLLSYLNFCKRRWISPIFYDYRKLCALNRCKTICSPNSLQHTLFLFPSLNTQMILQYRKSTSIRHFEQCNR